METDEFDSELRWVDIESAVDDFQSLLAASIPRLRIERNADVLDWQNKTGVYLLFSEHEQLLYVGYTLRGFVLRAEHHKGRMDWKWMDLIVFPTEIDFVAPALELFLRRRLLPFLDEGGNYV